jgi:hypothetical protein
MIGPIHDTLSHCTLKRMCNMSEINGSDRADDGSDDNNGEGAGNEPGDGADRASAGNGIGGPADTK